MRVLVTGGAGFIGSQIVDSLTEEGHDVSVVDDLSAGTEQNLNPRARASIISITDFKALEKVFAQERPEIVNHHAAQKSVRKSMSDPSFDVRVNVLGTINVLELCVRYGVTRLVFASTCAVYSEPCHMPMDESHPIRPQSIYGVGKHAIENYIRLYWDVYGLRYKVLRYANVYGPRQEPGGEAGVVAIFSGQLLGGVRPTIYGDGSKTRDYVFVEDIVEANLLAMGEVGDNDTYNLGRGIEVSDTELFETVREATGKSIEPKYGQKRLGEAQRVALDCSKAKDVWGWTPKIHPKEGVRRAVAYYSQQHLDKTG